MLHRGIVQKLWYLPQCQAPAIANQDIFFDWTMHFFRLTCPPNWLHGNARIRKPSTSEYCQDFGKELLHFQRHMGLLHERVFEYLFVKYLQLLVVYCCLASLRCHVDNNANVSFVFVLQKKWSISVANILQMKESSTKIVLLTSDTRLPSISLALNS